MADVFNKFIIEDGNLILAKCTFHKQLVTDKKKVTGGGWWEWIDDDRTMIRLYGDSDDFGQYNLQEAQKCIDEKKVYFGAALHRDFSNHKFILVEGWNRG